MKKEMVPKLGFTETVWTFRHCDFGAICTTRKFGRVGTLRSECECEVRRLDTKSELSTTTLHTLRVPVVGGVGVVPVSSATCCPCCGRC